jgi:hypothetical protein
MTSASAYEKVLVLDQQSSLDVKCYDGSDDLRNCETFKYKLGTDFTAFHKNDIQAMAISISFKGQNKFVSFDTGSGIQDTNKMTFGSKNNQKILISTEITNSAPPFINWHKGTTYIGPVWNGQWIQVGDFTIGTTVFDKTWAALRGCKATFMAECIDETKAAYIDSTTTLCGGGITITLLNNDNGLTSEEKNMFAQSGCKPTQLDKCIDCIQQKICCAKIQTTPAFEEWKGNGEQAYVTFWNLCQKDSTGTEKCVEYDKFVQQCSSIEQQETLDYCKSKNIGDHRFFILIPPAETEQARFKSIPKGCQ